MKLATLKNDTPDGQLVVVSRDGSRYAAASTESLNLLSALESWHEVEPTLQAVSGALEKGEIESHPVSTACLTAPLPRAWQWLDGSVYLSHGELMERLLGKEPRKFDRPLMYQGMSDTFYGPTEDIPFPTEELDIDFEGEFGILVDEVPMGVTPEEARKHIRLIVQINDWSLRSLAGVEMGTGFGWIQAKPPCSMAPFAITPDELGEHWKDHQVQLCLTVDWNGENFGNAHGGHMAYGFDELVAHAAMTRRLAAGTVIGSGTVSNSNYREVGSSCIAERRGIEIIDEGSPKTPFMRFGDRVRMDVQTPDGNSLFGAIDQKVVKAGA